MPIPFFYSDNCLSFVLFLKGISLLSLPVPCTFLLPQKAMSLDVPLCPVISCTKVSCCLRLNATGAAKRTFHVVSVFLILKVDTILVLNNFAV